MRDGRVRWKVENENNNVLKTKGYHIEHNFGHGNQHLASLLLSLNLLAFLFHTGLDLVDEQYRAIRQALGARRRFFQDLDALLRYFQFENWDQLLALFTRLFSLSNFPSAACFACRQSRYSLAWQVVKKPVNNPDHLHTNSFFTKGIASFGILRIAATS